VSTRTLRSELRDDDHATVRAIVASTAFFSADEEAIAVELVEEARTRGTESGYWFLFLEVEGVTIGYTCFGPIPATEGSWDLYWIAVRADARGGGHGRWLLDATERAIAQQGGRRVWVDTSSREQYLPTRAFYESCGYEKAAELADFYREGDGKVVYRRELGD